ncbi:class I SAM-dependent methyltransferase [Garicola koreensis]|uniref:Putative O-methyltransferase YrrM n=1 Tax=Garicola koreensis TaxID=1262554 RepID=A0A7W5U1N0_9MICC|nr:class I SAM-dependent methyltransferase [Garicola koreensis]MBB3667576.1 putative O-methyltransferase YrrM [Garicola koreensis]
MDHTDDPETVVGELTAVRSELAQLRREVAELRSDRAAGLGEARDELQTQFTALERSLQRHTTGTSHNTVRQVEAMWQLFPKVPRIRAQMPPSGGFPMEARTLLHLSSVIEEVRPRTILELGGGTSTIWTGYLTEELGTRIVSIDHLEQYLHSTWDYVQRHGFADRTECRLAPLEPVTVDGEEYPWYSLSAFSDLADVDLLVVDGPPESTGAKARYPALPLLQDKLSAGAVVVLDDTNRPDERAILEDWARMLAGYAETDQGLSKLGVLRPQASGGAERL